MNRRTAAAALLLGAGGFVASRPIGRVPALGPLLDPAHGVWAAAAPIAVGAHDTLAISGLGGPVRIVYDRRHVPHIFAATELDAYRALGYVVARDRLFQLEIQALASSGRLTEFAGAAALPLDRETRRLGLPRAAEAKLRAMAPAERAMLDAYAGGVNAYLATLGAGDLPVEFRLTNTRPAPWRAIDALHVMNRMGYTLAFQAREIDRAAAAARVGATAAAALFPDQEPIVEPVQPNGTARRATTSPRYQRRPRRISAHCASHRRTRRSFRIAPWGRRPTNARIWRATTGRSPRAGAPPATRSSRAIRTSSSRCRASGTRRTSSFRVRSTSTA